MIRKWAHLAAAAFSSLLLLLSVAQLVESKAILGVDLGSLYMKVALVQRGAPLEVVTNFHSKRKTENMILFDSGGRFYGADASSLLARKPLKTPAQMSLMLGRDDEHPAVKIFAERHFPITPRYNESRSGVSITVDGQDFTPEELIAMVLTHARDITQAYTEEQGKDTGAPPKDCVLTVPSFATVHERRALLDAAMLADLNVLGLLEENTASALHYAMDKQFPEPQTLVFYNMGGTAVQVSVVKFYNYNITTAGSTKPKTVGALEVLSKAWDSTVGGQSFDHRLVEHLADEFNALWDKKRGDGQHKDIRKIPRPMAKLRLQANKVKHVLSANTDIPVFIDNVYDDVSLSTHITRAQLEEMCHDLIDRSMKPIHQALMYANISLSDLDGIELIGGGMRIPRIQDNLKKALNDMELGLHINADESMALGAAFHGANISTAFRVRHVGLMDVNPFPIAITLSDLVDEVSGKGLFGKKKKDEKDGNEEAWGKHATILKSFGKMGVKKTIAFSHDKDVHCSLDYEESDLLPAGTERAIERYNITGIEEFAKEMEKKKLGMPKVSLQFELSQSGITSLIKAEATAEEIYTVEEEVEIEDVEDFADTAETNLTERGSNGTDVNTEDARELEENATEVSDDGNDTVGDANANVNVDKKPKKKTVMQQKMFGIRSPRLAFLHGKEKKRIHKRALSVKTYHVGRIRPYTPVLLEESKTKLLELAQKDKERMLLEEARNRVESYVYYIKNKLVDDEENINKVSTEEQRAHILKLAEKAQEWMDEDGANADLATTEDKYVEISTPSEKIFYRVSELTDRPEAIEALKGRLTKVEDLMTKWETSMPHITDEERADVLAKVTDVRKWIEEKEAEQAKKVAHEEPAFGSAEVPGQIKPIEMLVTKLKKKPKPKPPKKNETETDGTPANETNATNNTETSDGNATNSEDTNESDREDTNESDGEAFEDIKGNKSDEERADDEL